MFQGMIERLDTITRQLGLKLTKDQKRGSDRKAVEFEVFISSDMFYVEVIVEANGHVCDVKVSSLLQGWCTDENAYYPRQEEVISMNSQSLPCIDYRLLIMVIP